MSGTFNNKRQDSWKWSNNSAFDGGKSERQMEKNNHNNTQKNTIKPFDLYHPL